MSTYIAPLRDMRFVMTELAELGELSSLPGYEEATPELAEAVLEEAARLATEVLASLNKPGDEQGARLTPDGVVAADGFSAAYGQFVAGGWSGLSGDPEFGGQGLPELLQAATVEMWNSSNMAFALCPLLTAGATEALRQHGSDELKARYLPKMVSGEWTGTMNLTEPQAGSDLAAVRTKAVPDGDHYRLAGQKIFITWGDHDMTDNVIHLVLARTPDAPEGVRGISLFLVPKFLLNADDSPGARNDVHCVSLEHKLGIHASPTCVMSFGDQGGAIGYLVGQENKGLAHMFTMMNEARQKVGIQGLAIAERAYQQAREYAKERVQGRLASSKSGGAVAIIHHPDVRRMLMTMKSQIEAMRAFAYVMAADMDRAHRDPDAAERARRQVRVDLLIPVLKAWCTELGVEIASTGVQVHGGMGYIEETGACQFLRDARIAPIYEGTTGIQAADLAGRKLASDQGAGMADLVAEIREAALELTRSTDTQVASVGAALAAGVQALEDATAWMLQALVTQPDAALASSVDYLMLTGYVCGGWQMGRAALVAAAKSAANEDPDFHRTKLATARFYADKILPKANALLEAIRNGASGGASLPIEQF
ncbi:acyl-CoA dehydrogenase C-terminal domain-containing protein [Paraburkholderia sp. SEWSISQ10-3 4]|uniref:acyl-CoA dehydrogenase C-terminal domain-containing protein n=1 Tax=Paraburkholderia TaxID=1822464 RepID=UPI00224FB810|nr:MULTISPECIES: acyl-CoA dehydrogenase C-terminal domain-containing protein [Paraburkholderia]MCX4138192.1 acyl-CoA dehydrogenase C-terminal domain-containing protein [Paraburkholderia aspalathi]MDN7170883.1 acyl-CoA dehydrogenase C-terminal domain-containing protein [Paraburkholderia sp. SEWSISQ10-3 4]MDQ6500522.1 acyl-CoA dehydrogenase C-terminal domain-containing protein [Paraburkholderia aspalathi]